MIVFEDFQKLNEAIMEGEKQQLKDYNDITTVNFSIKVIENEVLNKICVETDPETLKPRFTNEMMRKSEHAQRLNKHEAYQEVNKTLSNLEKGKELRNIEIEGMKRMFAAMKSINYAGREE
ncbi:MAG: hypothetical protein WC307_05065 [Candidatus Nanoarchaeia archaeon]|jgi:hypothetical protein